MSEDEIQKKLKKDFVTLDDLVGEFKISKGDLKRMLKKFRRDGIILEHIEKNFDIAYKIRTIPKLEERIYKPDIKDDFSFGLISDTHLCSKVEMINELNIFYDELDSRGVKHVDHCGDLYDGWQVYKGHEYEVKCVGVMEQLDYLQKNFPRKANITTQFICLTPDHRVFVKNKGFVSFPEVRVGDEILSHYGKEGIKFTKVTAKQVLDYSGKIYKTNSSVCQMAVTPNHFVYLSPTPKYKKYRYETAEKAFKRSRFNIPCSGFLIKKDYVIKDDEIKILAWFISEGSWLDERRGIQIYQNEKGLKQITSILDRLRYKYSIYNGKGNKAKAIYISKENKQLFEEWSSNKLDISLFLERLSSRQLELFLNEYTKGDGNTQTDSSFVLYTKSKQLAEQLALAGILCGIRAKIHKRTRHIWNKKFEEYEIYFYRKTTTQIPKYLFSQFDYDGLVFDLTTEGQNFLVERNGTIFFTGNCGNHDLKTMEKTGVDVGILTEQKRPDMQYLGQYSAIINLADVMKIELCHYRGSMAQTISYRVQKYLRGRKKDTLPNILSLGHKHVSMFLQEGDTYCFEAGGFQGNTVYNKSHGICESVGGWIIDVKIKDNKIYAIKPEWIGF